MAKKYDSSAQRNKLSRPRRADDIRAFVIELAKENLGWGYTKIRDALRGLKSPFAFRFVGLVSLCSNRRGTMAPRYSPSHGTRT